METAEIDALLERFESAENRIVANFVELDGHPTYTMLSTGPLEGATAQAHGAAMARAPQLWLWLAALQVTLRRAREIRDQGRVNSDRRDELTALLTGPSVILAHTTTPVAQRDLLDDGQNELRVTVEQLLAKMRETYAPIRDAVAAVDATWREILPRLDAATTTVARLEVIAQRLSLTEPALIEATTTTDRLRAQLATDPVGVNVDDGLALDRLVVRAAKRIAEAKQGFDSLDADLAATESHLAELRVVRGRAAASHREAADKIKDPAGLIHPPTEAVIDGPSGLADRADDLLTMDGPWAQTRLALDGWLEKVDRLRRQLHRAAEANEAPLRQRSELRGLLSAYWVKVAAVGRSEDPPLTDLYDTAHNELFTAPADLDRAEQLVADLGAALRST